MKQAKIILPPLLLNRQLRLAYYPRVIYQLSRAVVSAGYCAQRWPIAGGSEADSGALSAHESAVAKPSKRCLCQAQETHDFLGASLLPTLSGCWSVRYRAGKSRRSGKCRRIRVAGRRW